MGQRDICEYSILQQAVPFWEEPILFVPVNKGPDRYLQSYVDLSTLYGNTEKGKYPHLRKTVPFRKEVVCFGLLQQRPVLTGIHRTRAGANVQRWTDPSRFGRLGEDVSDPRHL